MKKRRYRISIATLVSAAASLVAATASADSALVNGTHYTTESWEEWEGNGDIGNYHMLLNRSLSSWTPTNTNYAQHSMVVAESDLMDYGYVFGAEYEFISALADGHGEMQTNGSYSESANASFYVLGSQVASPTMSNGSNGVGASINSSFSRNLFHAEETFTVGFVPITVSADIFGNLNATVSSVGYGRRFIGRDGYFMGNPSASLNAGASVTANLSAFAGIEDVLAFGISVNDLALIHVSVTPHANELLITYPHHASPSWNVGTPVTVTTLSGRLDVWASTLFGDYSDTIVDWSGYSWTGNLWSDVNQATF